MDPDTAAAILNVDRDADDDTIRAAFKLRSRMWHPDRFASGTERERTEAATEFVRVTTASEVLLSRQLPMDENLKTGRPGRPDDQPEPHGVDRATPSSSLREYLGFGTSTTSFREYLGFGSTQK